MNRRLVLSTGLLAIGLTVCAAEVSVARACSGTLCSAASVFHLWVDGVDFDVATRVYATCEPSNDPWANGVNLKRGKHRAELRGTLLDGSMLKTREVEFELRCAGDAGVPDASTDGSAIDTLDATTETRAVDASLRPAPAPRDSAIAVDKPDARSDRNARDLTASGDGCALPRRREPRGVDGAWLGVAVALLLARRRRT